MKFPTADAQYAALMHFWKMYGLIERPPAARKYDKVTMEDKIKAFNLHHAGKTLTEISLMSSAESSHRQQGSWKK